VNKIVVVTGTPGVGKSTVISRAVEKLRSTGTDCEVINYGDFMLKIAKKKAGVTDRDEMRKLSFDIYQNIQKEAADDIARVAEHKLVLLDTHCTIKKPEGYYPGLPRWVLERLRPVTIVVIEAPPAEVLGRRTKDAKRRRDKELLAEIEEHQQLNRAIAMAYAAFTGAAVRIIVNKDGKLSDAVRAMAETLR
jgi:adenylate kinase